MKPRHKTVRRIRITTRVSPLALTIRCDCPRCRLLLDAIMDATGNCPGSTRALRACWIGLLQPLIIMVDNNSLVRPDHMLKDHRNYGHETAAVMQD
jgi:hypothetical protein